MVRRSADSEPVARLKLLAKASADELGAFLS